MSYKSYVYSTIGYGLFALLGSVGAIYSLLTQRYLLLLINLAIIYVSVDNFFCGYRARTCGFNVKSHYALPPFLKGNK